MKAYYFLAICIILKETWKSFKTQTNLIKLFLTQNGKLIELVTRSFFRLTLSIWNHAHLP